MSRATDLLGRATGHDAPAAASLDAALSGAHPGAIAAWATRAASEGRVEAAFGGCAEALRRRGAIDGRLTAVAACLRALPDHPGLRGALPLARAMDIASGPAAEALAPTDTPLGGADAAALEVALVDLLYARAADAAHLAPLVHAAIALARVIDDPAPLLQAVAARVAAAQADDAGGFATDTAAAVAAAEQLHAAEDAAKAGAFQEARFRPHLLGARRPVQVKAIGKALAYGVPRQLVASSLCIAAAERLLRFDPSHARSARRAETWLDMGWLIQVAEATRALGRLHDRPAWIGLLLRTADLVRAAGALDGATELALPEPEALSRTWDHGPEIARIVGHVQQARRDEAIAALRGYLLMVLPEQPLCAGLVGVALEDRAATPAEQGQLLATWSAALAAFGAAASLPHRDVLPAAAIHLWSQHTKPRPGHALALAAVDAAEGAGPRPEPSPLPWL